MREKELRIALVCYGGISLAVYMHGITKEIWRVAAASRDHHKKAPPSSGSQGVYRRLLERAAMSSETDLRVMVDILAGASAGGINAIFLAQAIATGRSLDPLTELWLDSADVDRLIDSPSNPFSRLAKSTAVPIAWALSNRSMTIDRTVEAEHRAEIRAKLSKFVRSRWFAPPFGGPTLVNLLLDAFDAMEEETATEPLLPAYQPLDLFVTVTDFRGHPEKLRLNSPPEVVEREHRLTLAFHDRPGDERRLADPAELVFAARATASFPGAFPPFNVKELDRVLEDRGRSWAGREAFLARSLPGHQGPGEADQAILIDGSVLANAPFEPAIAALERRPARREVDRRFVYIDPKPGMKSVRLGATDGGEAPGFFATIFGALSDIPREQPIRDNLERIESLSGRIRRLRRIVAGIQPEVEAAIEKALGSSFFLTRPTAKRIAGWRSRANGLAARSAGYAYAAYAHLKIASVVEDAAEVAGRWSGADRGGRDIIRQAFWTHVRSRGLTSPSAVTARGVSADVVIFLRDLDIGFRTRRLRFLVRRTADLVGDRETGQRVRARLNALLERYRERAASGPSVEAIAPLDAAAANPEAAMAAVAERWSLRSLDDATDLELADILAGVSKSDRRRLLLGYLGYPFFDVVTLPLLQGEGLDEFDPIKVDRISPDDAVAIRKGGTAATLKGIQLNSFGAFFSRAYRENDYLWGRLHGADRMIDLMVSTLPEGTRPSPPSILAMKREAFREIVAEERPRLTRIPDLFAELDREIG
jgi:patatin-related protein